jgi:hypothetical protein
VEVSVEGEVVPASRLTAMFEDWMEACGRY